MDYALTAKEILNKVGGEANIVGVMRKGGQYQIVIGNEVAKCYKKKNSANKTCIKRYIMSWWRAHWRQNWHMK